MKLSSIKPFQVNNKPSFQKFLIQNPKEIDTPVLYEILKQDEFKRLGEMGDFTLLKDKNDLHIVDLQGDSRDSFVIRQDRSDVAAFKAKDAVKEIANKRETRIQSFNESLILDNKIKDVIGGINKDGCRLVLQSNNKIPKQDVLDFVSSEALATVCEVHPIIVNLGDKVHSGGQGKNTLHTSFRLLKERGIESRENVDVSFKTVDPKRIIRVFDSKLAELETKKVLNEEIQKKVDLINKECHPVKKSSEKPALVISDCSDSYLSEFFDLVSSDEMKVLCKKYPTEVSVKGLGVNSASCVVSFVSGENSSTMYYDTKEGQNPKKLSERFDAKALVSKWDLENSEKQKAIDEKNEMQQYIKTNLKYFTK